MNKDELLKLINLREANIVERTTTGFRELMKSGYIKVPASKGIESAKKIELTREGMNYLVNDLGVESTPSVARQQKLLQCIYNKDIEGISMIEYIWLNKNGVIDLIELNSTNVRFEENADTLKALFVSMDK